MADISELYKTPVPSIKPVLEDIERRFELENDERKADVIEAINDVTNRVMRNK